MTDYNADHDGDQTTQTEWIDLWGPGQNPALLRYCILVAAVAIVGYLLTQLLNS